MQACDWFHFESWFSPPAGIPQRLPLRGVRGRPRAVGQSPTIMGEKGFAPDENVDDANRRYWSNSSWVASHLPCFWSDRNRSCNLGLALSVSGYWPYFFVYWHWTQS